MPLDCQLGIVAMWGKWEGFVKWLMECCRVEVWSKTRCWLVLVLAGDWEKGLYKLGCDRERLKMIKVNLRQSWWKPLTEDRPATPEPAWTIPSSDLTMPTNNWASALKSTYAPPPENSLLAQTGDMRYS
ncbi:hypothetical protein Tco_0277757 [Tanacetum coccineum]